MIRRFLNTVTGFGTVKVSRRFSDTFGEVTPTYTSTSPPLPNPCANWPVLRSRPIKWPLSVAKNNRGPIVAVPFQYASPRPWIWRDDLYCQMTLPVSGSSAVTVDARFRSVSEAGVETYITSSITSGCTWNR